MGGPGSGRSNRPITRNRPTTRWKCRWVPRRTASRAFTVTDAARIACDVVRNGGGTLDTIMLRARERCPPRRGGDFIDEMQNAAAISIAIGYLQENNVLLEDTWRAFLIINGILIGIAALSRILPGPLRVVALPAAAARIQVAALITRNVTQRAANDQFIQDLRVLEQLMRRAA